MSNTDKDLFAVSGDMYNEENSGGTLNEPIMKTVKRDVFLIYNKLHYFITAGKNEFDRAYNLKMLYNWDLWGPCIILLVLSSSLYIKAPVESKDKIFSVLHFFSIYGAIAVALNAQILGINCSFFAIISMVGYCIFPFTVISLISLIIPYFFVKLIFTIISITHIYRIIQISINEIAPEEKRILILYPISLFLFSVAFLVLIN
ncbi:YIP1 like transporter GTpase interacting factor having 5 transmembrane domain [Cryptosporidium sp. chipmunk genotype I]|uniref:YIP1 like transporter GTpase interacting factor having 5 transmembrane domain n=1 Tax=Cryptosporidium sp. chipmunk genotype I TaxID=1280935 RepID=UPI00351A8A0A|nr:YIP1 like transporter GTpase interacting factor having 5 transmembrane domain [Cryptosporidium sp. chipmunk genotype I]